MEENVEEIIELPPMVDKGKDTGSITDDKKETATTSVLIFPIEETVPGGINDTKDVITPQPGSSSPNDGIVFLEFFINNIVYNYFI